MKHAYSSKKVLSATKLIILSVDDDTGTVKKKTCLTLDFSLRDESINALHSWLGGLEDTQREILT